MRTLASALTALALAIPLAAQTVAQDTKAEVKGDKLWKIETSGIGG
jgi:ABC-type uncharacterized transport system YnjBCD substrate-binding protein